ncbi:sigma-70 family RNA polymerase sigma factor [Labrys sp. KB_33_2]|uniref:sigma-70 family RNA polymerase sigma factor n=1 Tax=unclassified Labrys (in: a-proteobacteria) TaxID=2688601 RepID=UPI003EB77DC7
MTENTERTDIVKLIPALRAFARTFCQEPTDADDLVQETLLKALANIDQFEPGTRLKSWLFTIMRNSYCTKAKKRSREVLRGDDTLFDSAVPSGEQEWNVRMGEVGRAFQNLPDKYKEIIALIVILGESYENAAQICGCAVGTVKSRLNRARARLTFEMGEEDYRQAS